MLHQHAIGMAVSGVLGVWEQRTRTRDTTVFVNDDITLAMSLLTARL